MTTGDGDQDDGFGAGRCRAAWRSTRSTGRSSSAPPRSSRRRSPSFSGTPKVLILRMRNVPAIDSTGLAALRDVVSRFRRAGTRVILSDVHAQPMAALQRSALGEELPEEDLVGQHRRRAERRSSPPGDSRRSTAPNSPCPR